MIRDEQHHYWLSEISCVCLMTGGGGEAKAGGADGGIGAESARRRLPRQRLSLHSCTVCGRGAMLTCNTTGGMKVEGEEGRSYSYSFSSRERRPGQTSVLEFEGFISSIRQKHSRQVDRRHFLMLKLVFGCRRTGGATERGSRKRIVTCIHVS